MKIVIKHGHVICPSQELDEICDIAIEDGKIVHVGNIPSHFSPDTVIDATHRWVVPGLVDLCNRPQMQHPQGSTLYQEAKAALQCGFTSLCIPPDGNPIIDTTANVLRITQQNDPTLPHLYPIGALTTQLEGKSIADLTALAQAGCIAFSQAQMPLQNLRLLQHCYDYAASFSLPIIIQPQEPNLAKGGKAHEGAVSSKLGLPGIPEIAETIAIAEHLLLIEKTGIRAHFTCLSTQSAVNQIQAAKARGLPVSADVAMHSLHLTEQDVANFDSNCHLYPPLRTEHDKMGLIEGVKNQSLDAICSDHRPLDSVAKLAPFGDTVPGLSALDTTVSLGIDLINAGRLTRLALFQALATQPAKLFKLPAGTLKVGSIADVCIIDPTEKWTVTDQMMISKGKNSPFKHRQFTGKVITTLRQGMIVYGSEAR